MKLKQLFAIFILSVGIFFPLFSLGAWCHEGHRAVANLAYQYLTQEAKASVDEILKASCAKHRSLHTFADLSTWPDIAEKNDKSPFFKDLHFIILPYDPFSLLSAKHKKKIEIRNKTKNPALSLQKALRALQDPKTSIEARCWALAYVAHVVADLHQPLHCCTRFSSAFPKGDRGGNLHHIRPSGLSHEKNLHKLWDHAGGLFTKGNACYIIPEEKQAIFQEIDPNVWIDESYQLAISVAYQLEIGATASPSYLEHVQNASQERIALASYRLASILNKTFTDKD